MRAAFSLIELSIVLVIISLMTAGSMTIGKVVVNRTEYKVTDQKLDELKESLAFFYSLHGRLPCPSSLTLKSGDSDFGREVQDGACKDYTTAVDGAERIETSSGSGVFIWVGALPTRDMILQDPMMKDEFNNRILYAVMEGLTSSADFDSASGEIIVNDGTGVDIATDVAFVLLSHGDDGKGATSYLGFASAKTCTGSQRDVENCNGDITFTDAPFSNEESGTRFFDDRIRWMTKELVAYQTASCSSAPAEPEEEAVPEGPAYAWGYGNSGQIGDGNTGNHSSPVAVLGGHSFTSIAAGGTHNCGLKSDGSAYCWGDGGQGQLGDGNDRDHSSPVAVTGGHSFTSIAAGRYNSCGIKSDGSAYCWGWNNYGNLGNGDAGWYNQTSPGAVLGGHSFTSIAVGAEHSCGLKSDGSVYCWGDGGNGRLGDGDAGDHTSPVAVLGGHSFTSIAVGDEHSCGLKSDGSVYCWGRGGYGQLGDGNTGNHTSPVAVTGGHSFTSIATGSDHSCGIRTDGSAYCWGMGGYGQLGDGNTGNHSSPVAVTGGHSFTSISGPYRHTCGLKSDGSAYCWGNGFYGQRGDGNTVQNHSSPVAVLGGHSFTSIAAGWFHTLAIEETP
jgi:prepilin-type N-terminal cleavage/methylation domain-containing protein